MEKLEQEHTDNEKQKHDSWKKSHFYFFQGAYKILLK